MDDVVCFYQQAIATAMKAQPGCQEINLLCNHHTRQFMLISLWQNPAALLAAEASAHLQTQLREMRMLLERPLTNEHYAVDTNETNFVLQL